jgi:hypothetical protein
MITKTFNLQPFAKRLAVPDLGDFENKQNKINPIIGFTLSQPPSTTFCSTMPVYYSKGMHSLRGYAGMHEVVLGTSMVNHGLDKFTK